MSRLLKDIYDNTQAALLNSECHPRDATIEALRAVALFADSECLSLTEEEFIDLARTAWENRSVP
jgi:hypothetical protein